MRNTRRKTTAGLLPRRTVALSCHLTRMAATPSKWHCMPAPSTGEVLILQAVAATWSFGRNISSPGREDMSLMTHPSPGWRLPGS